MSAILNLATYRFVSLSDLPKWRQQIYERAEAESMRGTVLLSSEGINIFVAGEEASARRWFAWLVEQSPFQGMTAKESWSDEIPFNRMLVRLKREIISMGVREIIPEKRTSPKISPDELRKWLDSGKEVTLLDVRNDYEVEVGTFEGAQAIGVDHFRKFPAAIERLPESMKEKPVVMFCTGGIRCEKAGPMMEKIGFREIYQLDGGILAYLQRHGSAHYAGDCFVFDKRVALDGNLQPSGLAQCYVCQAILTHEDQRSPRYQPGENCPYCDQGRDRDMRDRIALLTDQVRQSTRVLPGSVPHDNVRPINVPLRCDRMTMLECLVTMHPHLGREYWEQEFTKGHILQGRSAVTGDRIARVGQRYGHLYPNTVEPDVNAEIGFVWEDESILVVNKPAPLPMHPSGRFNRNTLHSILSAIYLPKTVLRPVHRLDANTTGLVVMAKTKAIATQLQRQFESGSVEKTYLADCHGTPASDEFFCDAAISRVKTAAGARDIDNQGDPSLTDFRVLRRQVGVNEAARTLLLAWPRTGRTNQIRLHLWTLGLPIIGDPVYLPGGQMGELQTLGVGSPPLRLHAWKLKLAHPASGETLQLSAPLPSWAGELKADEAAMELVGEMAGEES
jgi:RluA family pseudouridine synthase